MRVEPATCPTLPQEMLLVVPPPEPASTTSPSCVHYDPEHAAARGMTEEEVRVVIHVHSFYFRVVLII